MFSGLCRRSRYSVPVVPVTPLYRTYPALATVSTIEALVTRLDGGAPTAAPTLSATITTDNTGVAHVAASPSNYETGLLPSTTYYYVWTAFTANGVESLVSVERSIATGAGVTPAITTQLTGSVANAVKYRVYRGTAAGQQTGYYETTSTTFKDTGTLSVAFNSLTAQYAPPTVTNAASVTTASGAIPLTIGQLSTADLVAKKVAVWVDTGGGLVECPVYVRGLGRYSDGSYRSVYFKVNVGTALPTYPSAVYTTNVGYGTRRAVPTYPASGFRAQIRFGVARGTVDLGSSDLDATWGFCSAATKLPPQLWLETAEVRGFTPGVLAASDPDYLSKCGAFGVFATRAESETAGYYPTNGTAVAALALHYNTRFDTILRDLWYNGTTYFEGTPGWSARYVVGTIRCGGWGPVGDTVSKWFAGTAARPNSTARNTQGAAEPTYTGETPPQYGPLREMIGSSGGSSFEQQYYDPGLIFFQQYLRTGDLAYYQRACNYLWAYSWWGRWVTPADGGGVPDGRVIPFVYTANFAHQPEGIAYHTLLQGDPASQYHNQVFADNWYGDLKIADLGGTAQPSWPGVVSDAPGVLTIGGEPRPVVRATHAMAWAKLMTRPSGDAGISGGVALFQETRDWGAQVVTSVTKIFDTGTSWQQPAITAGGAVAWCQGDVDPSPTYYWINTFMQPMVCDLGAKMIELHPSLTTALKNKILARVKTNADFLFATMFEYDPNDNAGSPAGDNTYRVGNYKNFFDGQPVLTRADVHLYQAGGIDLTNMYTPTFAWLSWQTQDGSYTAIADRMFDMGIGLDDGYNAETSPFIASATVKQSREQYCFGHRMALPRSLGVVATALPSDTLAEVRVADGIAPTYAASTSTFAHGGSRTLIAKRRTGRRRIITGGSALVASVTAGGPNLSITSQTWNATYGRLVIVLAGTAAGSGTITVTDPDGVLTGTCAITVT